MKRAETGRFGTLMKRVVAYLGLDDMCIEINPKTRMCKLVLYRNGESVMSGCLTPVHAVTDFERVYKDFIDDWFINSSRGVLLMNMIKGCPQNYLISGNYNELEMKLTLAGC